MESVVMRRAWWLAVLLLTRAGAAFGFEGRIVMPDGSPAADATVSIIGWPGSARADAAGRFRWQPDPPVPFRVLVVLPGGRPVPPVRIAAIPEGGPVIVRIEPALTESVIVEVGAAPHIEAPPAAARTLLAHTDLVQRRPQRLADALENLPGTGRLEEGASVVPSVRGLARGRTLLLLDGARITAERRAGPSASFVDPRVLESIEVTRGPGSVAYGSDAFGGVVDARTRSAAIGQPLSARFEGTLGGGWPERSAAVDVSRGFERGGVLFAAHVRDLRDYESPSGKVEDSAASDRGLLLRGLHEAGPGLLSLGWQTDSGRDIGKPTLDSGAVRVFYPRETSNRLTASWDLDPRAGFTEAGLSAFLDSYRLVLDRDRAATATDPQSVSRADTEARDYGLRAFAGRPAGKGIVKFGLDLNGRFDLRAAAGAFTYDASGALVSEASETTVEDADRNDAGVYGLIDRPLGPGLEGSAGLRLDRVTTTNRGGTFGDRSTKEAAWAGHAALRAVLLRGFRATIQAARGFRDPTLSDRYFVGASGRGFVTGNPDLEPETSRQFDLALTWERPGTSAAIYAYEYRIEDLIERHEPLPGQFTFRNHGEARLRGLEIELRAGWPGGLSLEVAFQGASGRSLDDDTPLADMPPLSGNLVLRQSLRERGHLFLRAAAFARDDRPGPTETATPAYAVVDLGGAWRFRKALEIGLLWRNLGDREYPATSDTRSVAAPGRSVSLTMSAAL